MELFLRYKIIILRIFGILMLIVGFSVHFWKTPKEGFTQSEIAAANVARMEASVSGANSKTKSSKKTTNDYLQELKGKQEEQLKYLTIISMILGIGFVAYSFVKKN